LKALKLLFWFFGGLAGWLICFYQAKIPPFRFASVGMTGAWNLVKIKEIVIAVIPAKAGMTTPVARQAVPISWIPVFAGMTIEG
jgi:hypothetical protein